MLLVYFLLEILEKLWASDESSDLSKNSHYCLGVESWGECEYNPASPIVYFRMGQLLILFSIFVAVYKNLNPVTDLKIRASTLFKKF